MINLSWGRFPEQCIDKNIISNATAGISNQIGNVLANYSTPGGDIELRKYFSSIYGVNDDNYRCLGLTVSTNLSHYIVLKLYGNGCVITPDPTFSCYFSQLRKLNGVTIKWIAYKDLSNPELLCSDLKRGDIVSIVLPNNPTGEIIGLEPIFNIFKKAYKVGAKVIVDATWHHTTFKSSDKYSLPDLINQAIRFKSIVLLGISKSYGLSGLRCSIVFSAPEIVEKILSWSDDLTVTIGQFEQRILEYFIVNNKNPLYLDELISVASNNYKIIESSLSPIGYRCIAPSAGVFAYVQLPKGKCSIRLAGKLKENGLLVYPSSHFSKKNDGIRVCLSESENNTKKAMEIIKQCSP